MKLDLQIFFFFINFLQICWLIGYKNFYSLKKALILTGYLVTFIGIALVYKNINLIGFYVLFILTELFFTYQRSKSWTLVSFFYLFKNALMILSWLFTWHLFYYLWLYDYISPDLFTVLRPIVIIFQQFLLLLLITISRWINNQYSILESIAQLQKKYTLTSVFCLMLLLFLNVAKRERRVAYDLVSYFYLTVILLALTAFFSYTIYLISRYYQQQQTISFLTKKTLEETNKISLANEFQHDYRNILLSLNTYLNQNQLEQARTYLASIINYSSSVTSENFYSQISIVNILPIQGLLINFFENCQKNNISFHFSANQKISELDVTINLIDFIRCLSILLDNAVEATIDEKAASIYITFEVQNQQLIIEIRNTLKEPVILSNMLKNNYTTKKNHQGKGLHIFIKLLKQYNGADYTFKQEDHFFIARLSLPKSH